MALAITSFPVPVSPWIKTAESTGATISTSASNARNFELDPIRSKATIALLLYECGLFRVSSDQASMASFHRFVSRYWRLRPADGQMTDGAPWRDDTNRKNSQATMHKAFSELHLGSESKNYGAMGSTAHIFVVLHYGLEH